MPPAIHAVGGHWTTGRTMETSLQEWSLFCLPPQGCEILPGLFPVSHLRMSLGMKRKDGSSCVVFSSVEPTLNGCVARSILATASEPRK